MTPPLCPECLRAGSQLLLVTLQREHPETPVAGRPSIRGIATHAERLAGVEPGTVAGRSRKRAKVHLRRAAAWVARQYPYSLPVIGKALGGRDHSSVLHLVRTCDDFAARDPEFARFVDLLWAAAECEPRGPGRVAEPPAEAPADVPSEVEIVDAVDRVLSSAFGRAARAEPGEYVPPHALPLTAAMIEADCGPSTGSGRTERWAA